MLLATILGVTLGVLSARKPGGFADRFALGARVPRHLVPGLLGRTAADPAVRRHAALAAAVGLRRPALSRPSRAHARHALDRVSRAHDALGDARRAERRLRAHGAREGTAASGVVTLRHALRNALIPVITVLGLDFGAYLTGSILTETIFSWPGHRPLRRERDLAARPAGDSGHRCSFSARCSCS